MIPTGENRWYATGKRKSAVARVWLTPGSGQIYVRKWRVMPKTEDQHITYIDPRTGEQIEELLIFPEALAQGQYAVPYTARAGKKPFRYTPMDEYFGRETLRMIIQQPFKVTKMENQFDVYVNVHGGGLSGQAGAIRHGISRALLEYERFKLGIPEAQTTQGGEQPTAETAVPKPVRRVLKREGLLTRDARVKERKKYGRPGARKRFQYSKR
jgi:small subunit ribosomal protein S9